jgi:hypothetical protein
VTIFRSFVRCGQIEVTGSVPNRSAATTATTFEGGVPVGLPVGPLFCVIDGPTRGRPWSSAAVRREFRRLAAQAGLRRRFAPHQLRHAHAVELARDRTRTRSPASATRVGEQRNGRRSRRHARVRRAGQRLPQPARRRISAHGRAAARGRDRQSRAGERCSPSHVRPVACPEATTRTTSVYRSLGVLRASAEIVGRRASLEPALVSVGSARANFAARVRQSLLSPGATQGPYARTSRPVESRHERSRPRGPTRADRAPCAAALPLTPERA